MRRLRLFLVTICVLAQACLFSVAFAGPIVISGTCVTSKAACSPPNSASPRPCASSSDTCQYSAGTCSGGTDPTTHASLDGQLCIVSSPDCGTGNSAGICQYSPECFQSDASCKAVCSTGAASTSGGSYFFDTANAPPVALNCRPTDHLCYCIAPSYQLEIPFGTTTQVVNISDYVQKFYRYLLGFSIIVAIIMVMIGGLQYVLASSTGDTKNAKTRITNAVIGLALLFCAALILQTVNPQLMQLQAPVLPAMNQIPIAPANNQGGPCRADADCPKYWACAGANTNTGTSGTCVATQAQGLGICSATSPCASGQICNAAHCAMPGTVHAGANCTVDTACISGNCASNGSGSSLLGTDASGYSVCQLSPEGGNCLLPIDCAPSTSDCSAVACTNGKCVWNCNH